MLYLLIGSSLLPCMLTRPFYFVSGVLYNKTVHDSSGKELIPHHQFWEDLPGLIKDGYWFFISPCVGDRVEYRYYERL